MKKFQHKKPFYFFPLLVIALFCVFAFGAGKTKIAFASMPAYNQSFDSFSGALGTNGDWSGSTGQIVDTQFYDGTQSLYYGESVGSDLNDIPLEYGSDEVALKFYWRTSQSGVSSQTAQYLYLAQNNTDVVGASFIKFDRGGSANCVKYRIDTQGADVQDNVCYSTLEWHYMDIVFSQVSGTYKYRTDPAGAFTTVGGFTSGTYPELGHYLRSTHSGQTGQDMYLWFDKFGDSDSDVGENVFYNSGNYSLRVDYPQLDENYHANVQPATEFQVRVKYIVPDDAKATTQFWAEQCYNTDMTDCDPIATNIIQDIEDTMPDDLKGSIIFVAPVVVDETTLLYIKLGDNVAQKKIIVSALSLTGVNDPLLPNGTGASNAENISGQEDLGFLGNSFRYWFSPSSDFLASKVADFTALRDEKFPLYGQVITLITSLEQDMGGLGGSAGSQIPTMSLYGSAPITVFDATPLTDYLPTFKNYIRIFLWFFCAIFCIRGIHSYFKPESSIVTNL